MRKLLFWTILFIILIEELLIFLIKVNHHQINILKQKLNEEGYQITKEDKDQIYVEIAAIDNGLSFPIKFPPRKKRYVGYWASIPLINESFSQSTKNHFINSLSNSDLLSELYKKLKYIFQLGDFYTELKFKAQMDLLNGQIENLKTTLNRDLPPSHLFKMPNLALEWGKSL